MDNIPTAILIALDADGAHIIGNRAACDLFAVPYGSDFAEPTPAFRDPHGFVVPRETLPLWRALQWERSVDASDYEIQRRDGMRRFVTMAAAPLYDGWGSVSGAVAILVDVTYLRAQERSLRLETYELNELIAREQRITEILLKAQLPRKLPDVDGFSLSAVYRPSDAERNIVGGDWYDAFPLPDGCIGLSVGEVNGSGVSAAVAMAKMRQAIQSAALVRPDPATMLRAANATLALHDAEASATAVAGVLDPATAKLTFTSAGHPLPVVRERAGYVREFRGVAAPLGDYEGAGARTHSAALKPGDLAVFFTDGLLEAAQDGVSGGHLLRSVLTARPISLCEGSAEQLRRTLFDDRSGSDDVVILTIARCGEAAAAR